LKTVEAVQYGVPVVSTEEAAAGLDDVVRRAVWVAGDAAGFADAVVALLSDRSTWERQRKLSLAASGSSSAQRLGVGMWPAIIRSARASRRRSEVAR
jgi:glycosyltransferase involved in cell wall biosynthesis